MSIKFITRLEINNEIQNIIDSTYSKSQKIRTLYSLEVPKVQISELLNIRYQHVRNVLQNPPKK